MGIHVLNLYIIMRSNNRAIIFKSIITENWCKNRGISLITDITIYSRPNINNQQRSNMPTSIVLEIRYNFRSCLSIKLYWIIKEVSEKNIRSLKCKGVRNFLVFQLLKLTWQKGQASKHFSPQIDLRENVLVMKKGAFKI